MKEKFFLKYILTFICEFNEEIQNLKVSDMNFKKCKTSNQYGKVT